MSFFEKLKKGVGIEEEAKEKKPQKKETKKEEKPKMEKITEGYNPPSPAKVSEGNLGGQATLTPPPKVKEEKKKEWFEPEGQLAIDVYQTDDEILIQSAIAGVSPQNLDITIENDMVTIRGVRERPADESITIPKDYFYQECYWGPFSRQIILPAEVDGSRAEATMKEGILTVRIPKIQKEKKRKIVVKE